MGIFETFKNIAKKETVRRSKLPGLVRDMRSDIVEHRRTTFTPDAPAVDSETSKSEFSEQYKTVQNMSLVSFIYVLCMATYSTYTAVQSENVLSGNFITIICLLVIGSLWHFSFCLRALRARRVASLWESRNEPLPITYSEFFDEALGDPLVFMPFFKSLSFPSGKMKNGN